MFRIFSFTIIDYKRFALMGAVRNTEADNA